MNREKIETETLYFTEKCQKQMTAILKKPVVIVEAPMGYGKTVAVWEYLKNKPVEVIWIPMVVAGSDPWEFFCQRLEEHMPEAKDTIWHLRTMGVAENEDQIRQQIAYLKMLPFKPPTVMVIEDYQLVNTMHASRLVESFAYSGWKEMHLVLLTRDVYCGNREMLSLRGRITTIGKDCFVLGKEDIKKYYQACGVVLEDEAAEQLSESTEGWIAALYLYLLRYKKEGILALPTNIFELIDQELFSNIPEELQQFLCAMSPFDTFTYEQADYVWKKQGGEHTHEMICMMREKNAFVIYGDQTERFYVHSIFRQFLEQRVWRQAESVRRNLYESCGDWFFMKEDYLTAMTYYRESKNYVRILEAMRKEKGSAISIEIWPKYCELMDEIPRELLASYQDVVWMFLMNAFLQNDRVYYREFQGMMKDWNKAAEDGMELSHLYEIIMGIQCYNDIDQMMKHFKKAKEAAALPYQKLGLNWMMGCPSVLMMFYAHAGQLDQDMERVVTNMPVYSEITEGHGSGGAELMQAEVMYNRGEFKNAEAAAYEARTIAEYYHQHAQVCTANLMLMRCAMVQGNGALILQGKADNAQILDRYHNKSGLLRRTIELGQIYVDVMAGNMEHVPEWLKNRNEMKKHVYLFSYPVYMLIHGRYLLEEKEYARTIGTFQALVKEDIYGCHAWFLLYADIYIAAALYALGKAPQAMESLMEALDIALLDRIYMPFAENRRYLNPLYEALGNQEPYRDIVGMIQNLADRLEAGTENTERVRESGAAKRLLSKREREIAGLALQGYTNRQIAEELFIAPSTVKRAMVEIFKKLGIHGRTELADYKKEFDK